MAGIWIASSKNIESSCRNGTIYLTRDRNALPIHHYHAFGVKLFQQFCTVVNSGLLLIKIQFYFNDFNYKVNKNTIHFNRRFNLSSYILRNHNCSWCTSYFCFRRQQDVRNFYVNEMVFTTLQTVITNSNPTKNWIPQK